MNNNINYWSKPASEVFNELKSSPAGLTEQEAEARLKQYGNNSITRQKKNTLPMLFLNQFKNPIIIILLIATAISAVTGDIVDSLIIFAIILISALLSFFQEYSANNVVEELRQKIQSKARVLRNGQTIEISSNDVVPGDILLLSAGSLISSDGLIIESTDFLVNQSALTGESIPSEKNTNIMNYDTDLSGRTNCVYMGTNVKSGSAKAIVVNTGEATEFGRIAEHLKEETTETDFERGIRHFGYLLSELMLTLTLIVFAINVIFQKPPIDSLLFSVALAVGITPQLLPAIISITLSQGSKIMAKEGVIVRKLTSIENFGSMDVLCTDKTGTLTEGVVHLDGAVDVNGTISNEVFAMAYANASLQTGLINTLDKAIMDYKKPDIHMKKIKEIPYDFTRKCLSVIVEEEKHYIMITKGALNNVLSMCSHVEQNNDVLVLDDIQKSVINEHYSKWSDQGIRVLGISKKEVPLKDDYSVEDESEMTFIGFLLFFDPPKKDVKQTIDDLRENGVQLRMITGDNKLVAMHTAQAIGLNDIKMLTGSEMMKLKNDELPYVIENINVFAEVDPDQKERIINALKKRKHVVGYMGDGINDVPSLHAADIGISVDTAVDVAKESADFVLLEKSLKVLNRGIVLGRTTFTNTLKYIMITTSANFGNMFSMAGASLFMPFLPLLPKQILLINFLTDFPALTISADVVDEESLKTPKKWDIKFIRNFMLVFGTISSIFDYITFFVMLVWFKSGETLFQSSWFVLSIITELMVLMIMRTQKPFFKSRPAPILLYSTISVAIVTLLITYLPINSIFSIEPIPPYILLQLIWIVVLYVITTEIAKHYFFKKK